MDLWHRVALDPVLGHKCSWLLQVQYWEQRQQQEQERMQPGMQQLLRLSTTRCVNHPSAGLRTMQWCTDTGSWVARLSSSSSSNNSSRLHLQMWRLGWGAVLPIPQAPHLLHHHSCPRVLQTRGL